MDGSKVWMRNRGKLDGYATIAKPIGEYLAGVARSVEAVC